MTAQQTYLKDFKKKSFYSQPKTLLLNRHLLKGIHLSQAARLAGMSKQLAHYYVSKWKRDGSLRQISKQPAIYEGIEKLRVKEISGRGQPSKGPARNFEPHRFGVKFLLRRKPKKIHGFNKVVKLRNWKQFIWREGDFTLELYPNLLKVWCFAHRGDTPPETIRRGALLCRERALEFESAQGCKLCAGELLEPIEWTIHNQELSDYVRAVLDLDNAPVVITGSKFIIDESHPDKVELNEAENTKNKATEAAKKLDWLMTDGIRILEVTPTMFKGTSDNLQEINGQIEGIAIILKKIVDKL